MSTLKVNTLSGTTAAGSIVVTGEGNSTTTNLQQGLAKWWITLDGIGTVEARDSFNNSSITDEATGKYTFTINNDMSNTDYTGYYYTTASTSTGYENFGNAFTGGFGSFATGSFGYAAYASGYIDSVKNFCGIFGDLA